MKYPHIRKAIVETPWVIIESQLGVICEIVEYRMDVGKLTAEELEERLAPSLEARAAAASNFVGGDKIALLPLHGVLIPRADMFAEMSGATSLESWGQTFDALVASAEISTIVIDVDSPGGSVSYTEETAAKIARGAAQKTVIACANPICGSGAYWLASQASELVMTPSGMVGSIGVINGHEDISGLQEKLGIKTTLVHSGKNKVELSPFTPLSDAARADLQAKCETTYNKFVDAVASGRGVSTATVRSPEWGEGRVLFADEALRVGMVDRVATLQEVLDELLVEPGSGQPLQSAQLAEISDSLRQTAAIVKGTP